MSSTAPDMAFPSRLSTVIVERRDANQGCDLFAVHRPQLRQFGDHAADQDRTHAWNRIQ